MTILNNIQRKIQLIGLKETIGLIFKRIINIVLDPYTLFFFVQLENYVRGKIVISNDIKVRKIETIDDLKKIEKEVIVTYGTESLLEDYRNLFKEGHKLYLTYYKGEVAGASWISIGIPQDFTIMHISNKDFYIFAVFTIDEFRNKGIGTANLVLILEEMKNEKYSRAFICTKEWNPYQKSIKRAGFQYAGKFIEYKWKSKRIAYFVTGNIK